MMILSPNLRLPKKIYLDYLMEEFGLITIYAFIKNFLMKIIKFKKICHIKIGNHKKNKNLKVSYQGIK